VRIGVLISGRGSNLQSLVDAQTSGSLLAEISVVVSNVPDVQGLEIANENSLATEVINHANYSNREKFDTVLHETLLDANVDLVCLAGFMRILTGEFVNKWTNRMINIHPSLLPSFKGLNTHQRVLDAGVRFTGCTTHFVRPAMDEGPIIIQSAVPILEEDNPKTLAARVLLEEHKIYPATVRMIVEDRVRVEGDVVRFKNPGSPSIPIMNPPK